LIESAVTLAVVDHEDVAGVVENKVVLPVAVEEDWGKLLGDSAAVSAMLDRLLHHGHVLKCGPRSWRTKTDLPHRRRQGKRNWSRNGHFRWPVLK
jgi:hypothetical protein